MRHVFETREVPHLWAHETQEDGRNPRNNLFFRNRTIYSYGAHFPIARIVVVSRGVNKGRKVVFFTTSSYSTTTAKHISFVRGSIPNYPVVHCSDPEFSPAEVLKELRGNVKVALTNFKNPLVGGYGRSKDKKKNKVQRMLAYREFLRTVAELEDFVRLFDYKVEVKRAKNHDELIAALEEYDRANEQRAAVRRSQADERWMRRNARYQEEHAERQRVNALKTEEQIAEWRAGKVAGQRIYGCPTMLRIKDDNVETSKGVEFPIEHALRVLPLVERILIEGRTYQANGHTIHLGHYQLDSIDEDGTVHAGCHHIPKDEVLRLIGELKELTPVG